MNIHGGPVLIGSMAIYLTDILAYWFRVGTIKDDQKIIM